MLAFLAGELTNSAYYFSTFANVHKDNANVLGICYDTGKSTDWMPFTYQQRLNDAKLVEWKKVELLKKNNTAATFRRNTTTYIRSLKSRQEFVPLVEKYIDKAKAEPLYLKNNVCKEMFMKIWDVVISVAQVNTNIKQFKYIPHNNLLYVFVQFVCKDMKSNKLAKKLKEYWSCCRETRSEFSFRFRGEESRNYLTGFPLLISMLFDNILIEKWRIRLIVIFILSIDLRKLISYTVRVKDIIMEDVIKMELVAKKMFKLCCLHDKSMSPSLWTLCVITPVHTKSIFTKLGLGLGLNSMEGREQKHQKIYKYMQNSTVLERWQFVFRHEFISCVYLRENGFDQRRYNKRIIPYVPSQQNGYLRENGFDQRRYNKRIIPYVPSQQNGYLRENGFDQRRYNKRIIPYVPSQQNGYCLCGLLFDDLLQNICKMCDSKEFAVILQSLKL